MSLEKNLKQRSRDTVPLKHSESFENHICGQLKNFDGLYSILTTGILTIFEMNINYRAYWSRPKIIYGLKKLNQNKTDCHDQYSIDRWYRYRCIAVCAHFYCRHTTSDQSNFEQFYVFSSASLNMEKYISQWISSFCICRKCKFYARGKSRCYDWKFLGLFRTISQMYKLYIAEARWNDLKYESLYIGFSFQCPAPHNNTENIPTYAHCIGQRSETPCRARIFKLLRSPGIDSKESIPPAYVAWRAGTIALFLLGS